MEVKNRQGLTAEIAKVIRRNLVAHGFKLQPVPYFLVVSEDAGFLWIQRPPFDQSDPPTVEFLMRPVISH
jgi:hypothetical protein